ncbi:MAG: hypothetical protein ABW171_12010 [Steroidobacter sp.]
MQFHSTTKRWLQAVSTLVAMAALGGCISVGTPTQPLPLQDPAIQTHEFEADKTLTMSAVMSVLQDLGYILEKADKDVGFITASSPARRPGGMLSPQLMVMGEPIVTTTQAHATAVIESARPGFTSVRLNLLVSSHSEGQSVSTTRDEHVLDAETYRTIFKKIDEAIAARAVTASGTR